MARSALASAKRVVVKVGTHVVARDDGGVALGRVGQLVESLAQLRAEGRDVLLVSSGAVGLGMRRLGFERAPTSRYDQRACAAAGQGELMGLYDSLFARVGHHTAQVLLTEDDFHHRARSVALAATLERLLARGAVPVLNENDAVSPDLRAIFGDNDRLAALVASHVDADALVLLSDVDAVYDRPPDEPGAQRIATWRDQAVQIGAASRRGRGGMKAKIEAAALAAQAGVHCVISSGHAAGQLERIAAGDDVGTWFPAGPAPSRRRRWIAFATASQGALYVNTGAREALVERQASLLAPGVERVDGQFEAGAVLRVVHAGQEIGRGVCGRSRAEVDEAIASPQRGRPLMHRDDLVIHTDPVDEPPTDPAEEPP